MTNAEVILWSRLRRHPVHKFRRQHPVGKYIADFACIEARIVVEVDGATHGSGAEIEYDRLRSDYLRLQGWKIVRVWNDDVYRRLSDVLDAIEEAIARTC